MQDLIDEKEFIEEKPYNPWPFFFLCYAVVICCGVIESLTVYLLPEVNYVILAISHLSMLITLSAILLFGKRKVTLLPAKVLTEGLLGLIGTNFLVSVVARLFTYFTEMKPDLTIMELVYKAGAHFAAFLILCAIFLPIASRRRKKLLRFSN